MFLRSRSIVKLPSLDSNHKCDDPMTANSSSQFSKIPGGARLWRYLMYLTAFAITVYIILYDSFNIEEEGRPNIPPNPKKRQLTIVMNTFKRHDLLLGT